MLKKLRGSRLTLHLLVLLAILVALSIIVGQFLSFGTNVLQVSFSFVMNTIIGTLAGPVWTGLSLAIEDVIGTLLFGKYGYFPGFTLSAFIVGLLYGLFFFRKKLTRTKWQDWLYTFFAMALIMLVDTAFFNTLWVTLLYKAPFTVNLATRLPLLWQIPLRTLVVMLIIPALQNIPFIKKTLSSSD
ncbi:folate family ECF transporter S component [Lactovum odontotermitis]